MDGDLVDEHVVVVLVEDHEVVARSSRKFKKKCRRLFFFSLWQEVCFTGLGWCRRERCSLLRTPRSKLVAIAQSRRVY